MKIKILALFVVFSLVIDSGNLVGKERLGAELGIQKKDGQQVSGELIAVRQDFLLLVETDSGEVVLININKIKRITIGKKSRVRKGIFYGFLLGGGIGALGLGVGANIHPVPEAKSHVYCVIILGLASGFLGAVTGSFIAAHSAETIQVEGRSDSEIKEVLKKLRSKARVPEY